MSPAPPSKNVANASLSKQLLDSGVPGGEVCNASRWLRFLFFAGREGQVDSLQALVDARFNPTMAGPRGWTALMLASARNRESGGNGNASDADAHAALDWALTRGETDAAALLGSPGTEEASTIHLSVRRSACRLL